MPIFSLGMFTPARILAAFGLAVILGAGGAGAEDSAWTSPVDYDGIRVQTRSVAGSAIEEVRAVIEIAAPPQRVFAVLLDSDRFVEFMPYVVEVRTMKRESPGVWYLFQRISPPFVSNRYYTLRQQSFEEPQRLRYELRWEAANEHGPAAASGVRVDLCTGSYVVQGTNGGTHSQLTYQLLTDPGGWLPGSLINYANSKSVPELLRAVARRSVEPSYQRK